MPTTQISLSGIWGNWCHRRWNGLLKVTFAIGKARSRTQDFWLPVPIKVIILPVTLVQIWEGMWFFTMSHPQWPVYQKALWCLSWSISHICHFHCFPTVTRLFQVSITLTQHTFHLSADVQFPDLPCVSEFPPAWPAYPSHLCASLQLDPQADAKIIFLKHPEHTCAWSKNWTESQKPSVPLTKLGSIEHWLQYPILWERGLWSWGNTVCTLPFESHSLLNQYFPKLFDCENSLFAGNIHCHLSRPNVYRNTL